MITPAKLKQPFVTPHIQVFDYTNLGWSVSRRLPCLLFTLEEPSVHLLPASAALETLHHPSVNELVSVMHCLFTYDFLFWILQEDLPI